MINIGSIRFFELEILWNFSGLGWFIMLLEIILLIIL